jgi:5-methyltetrahydrofolate--homocysteine methyltransferase
VSPSACAEANLVDEIDGDSHAQPDQAEYDTARTRWLEEHGYRVIRFTAEQVEEDLAGVVEGIRRAFEEEVESLNRIEGGLSNAQMHASGNR